MNKTEMAAKLAEKTGLTKVQAADVVNALFETAPGEGIIAIELDAGRTVTIPGFGTFSTATRKARQGRNPQTGATINIAARTVPVFKAGKGLKERVRV
ncbi:MAG: HU family DNA-binding protein [Anaerolineae bacterium]